MRGQHSRPHLCWRVLRWWSSDAPLVPLHPQGLDPWDQKQIHASSAQLRVFCVCVVLEPEQNQLSPKMTGTQEHLAKWPYTLRTRNNTKWSKIISQYKQPDTSLCLVRTSQGGNTVSGMPVGKAMALLLTKPMHLLGIGFALA